MANDIFISYSRKDAIFAQKLVDTLQKRDLAAWIDWEDIAKGDQWLTAIYRGIESTNAFVLILSPDSLISEVCHQEIAHARQYHKKFIPVIHRDFQVDDLQAIWGQNKWNDVAQANWQLIRHINWVPFRASDNFDTSLATLIETIHTDLDYVKMHTRLTIRAVEWDNNQRNVSYLLIRDDLEAAENWLSTSANVNPRPTDLQSQYILASRAAETRRQRTLLVSVTAALFMTIGLAILAVYLFLQSQDNLSLAEQRGTQAADRAAEAVSAASTAESNAASLRSLSLTTSAEQALSNNDPELAVALAVQANRLENPPADALSILYQAAYAPYAIRDFEGNARIKVALSPDGKTAFGYFYEWGIGAYLENPAEGLYLWDMATGERLRSAALDDYSELTGFGVASIAMSADGKRAVVIGFAGFAVVWDIENWQQLAILDPATVLGYVGLEQDGFGVAINADGSQVLSGSSGGVIRWDVSSGEVIQVYTGPIPEMPIAPELIVWSPDGRLMLVSGYSDISGGALVDVETGEMIHELIFSMPNRLASLVSAAFSPDGRLLMTGHRAYGAVIWDVNEGDINYLMPNATGGSAIAVAISPDGLFYALSDGANVEIWALSLADNEPYRFLTFPQSEFANITSLAFGPDNHTLLAAYESGEATQLFLPAMTLWRFVSGAALPVISLPSALRDHSNCCGLYFPETGELHEIDLNTGEIRHTLENRNLSDVIYSGDGKRVLVGETEGGNFVLWDLETDHFIAMPENLENIRFAASPDGRYFAVYGYDGYAFGVYLVSAENGEVRQLAHLQDIPLTDLVFASDSAHIMATTSDFFTDLLIWDVATGQGEIRTPNFSVLDTTQVNYQGINAQIHLIPDGPDLLIVPDGSDMLRLDTMTGEIKVVFADSNHSYFSVSVNDRLVVAGVCLESAAFGCNQMGLRVWDARSGAKLMDIPTAVSEPLWDLHLGKSILWSQSSTNLHRFRLETPIELIARLEAEGRVRQFTTEECRRFALPCAQN